MKTLQYSLHYQFWGGTPHTVDPLFYGHPKCPPNSGCKQEVAVQDEFLAKFDRKCFHIQWP